MINNFKTYIKDISRFPQYTDGESIVISRKIKSEREKIINGNLKLIVKIAGDMANLWPNFDIMDFIQEGNLTLMRIIDTYDPSRSKFSTHVSFYVRGAIIDFIKNTTGPVRLCTTRNQREVFRNLTNIKKQFTKDGISMAEIAKNFKVDTHTINVILGISTPGDINNIKTPSPEQYYLKNEATELLLNKIHRFRMTLNDTERMIFDENIYKKNLSLQDVACYFDVTRQNCWKIRNVVLKKARLYFTMDDLNSITE